MNSEVLKRSIRAGLLGGVLTVYLAVIGMVATLGERDLIVGVLSVGHTLLIIVFMTTGYLNARRLRDPRGPDEPVSSSGELVLAGLASGLFAGAMLGALVAIGRTINLRTVLINVSPELLDLLSLGVSGQAGALVPFVLGTGLTVLGALVFVLPTMARRMAVVGVLGLTFVGLIAQVIRTSLSWLPPVVTRALFSSLGLRPLGAGLFLALILAFVFLRQRWAGRWTVYVDGLPPSRQRSVRYGQWGLLIVLLLTLPWIVGQVPSDVLVNVGIFVLLGFGLNIVVGKAGLLDLGYVAFFAVGAYSMAIFTSADELPNITLTFWLALPLVVIVTGIAGLMVGAPVLRMRGDYLAIVTLGFGEIARFLALSDWFSPVLGGAQGVLKIPNVSVFGIELVGPRLLYYLILFFSLIALFVSYRLENTRVGRAWVAMREDETVAEVMGINTVYYKLLAFGMGAMIASLGGAVFAVKLSAIFPHSFDVEVSITALSLLIIGGLGSLPGVIVGAFALVGLPELLREFEEFRLLIYGAVLIFMMLVRPQGLMPEIRREREITEEERAQDAFVPGERSAESPAISASD